MDSIDDFTAKVNFAPYVKDITALVRERDRQQFEAGWRARGEADKDLLREAAHGSMWEYYSPVVVGALKNMPPPAAQPAEEGKP